MGKKPKVSHLKIFRSVAYCHIPKEKWSKLEETNEARYLVGYSENSKVYLIYIPRSRKIIVRQDANFMEDRAFKKSHEMTFEEQDDDAPLVKQQGSNRVGRQGSGSSTVTSTSISSRKEDLEVSQRVQ